MIGQRMRRSHDGFIGIIVGVSTWSSFYFVVESASGQRELITERELKSYWTELSLPALLAEDAAAWSRRMTAIPHMLRWLCEQLVRALLFGAWDQMIKREGAALDRAFYRFCALVDAAPCWPCRVEFEHPGRTSAAFFFGFGDQGGADRAYGKLPSGNIRLAPTGGAH